MENVKEIVKQTFAFSEEYRQILYDELLKTEDKIKKLQARHDNIEQKLNGMNLVLGKRNNVLEGQLEMFDPEEEDIDE